MQLSNLNLDMTIFFSFQYVKKYVKRVFFRSWTQNGRRGYSTTIFAVIQSIPGQNTVAGKDSLLNPVCYCDYPDRHRVSCGSSCPTPTTTPRPTYKPTPTPTSTPTYRPQKTTTTNPTTNLLISIASVIALG